MSTTAKILLVATLVVTSVGIGVALTVAMPQVASLIDLQCIPEEEYDALLMAREAAGGPGSVIVEPPAEESIVRINGIEVTPTGCNRSADQRAINCKLELVNLETSTQDITLVSVGASAASGQEFPASDVRLRDSEEIRPESFAAHTFALPPNRTNDLELTFSGFVGDEVQTLELVWEQSSGEGPQRRPRITIEDLPIGDPHTD